MRFNKSSFLSVWKQSEQREESDPKQIDGWANEHRSLHLGCTIHNDWEDAIHWDRRWAWCRRYDRQGLIHRSRWMSLAKDRSDHKQKWTVDCVAESPEMALDWDPWETDSQQWQTDWAVTHWRAVNKLDGFSSETETFDLRFRHIETRRISGGHRSETDRVETEVEHWNHRRGSADNANRRCASLVERIDRSPPGSIEVERVWYHLGMERRANALSLRRRDPRMLHAVSMVGKGQSTHNYL